MSKRIPLWLTLILLLLSVLITFQTTFLIVNNKYARALGEISLKENVCSKLASVDEKYRALYMGEIDENMLSDYIIAGYVAGTGDRYGSYMNSEDFKEYMSDHSGELVGIGVFVIYNAEYKAIEIISVMPNSPALEAGLLPGDLIIAVGDISVAELGYYGTVSAVKGEQGTNVEILIARQNSENEYNQHEFKIERRAITETTVMSHMHADGKIGIVQILSFDVITPSQFKEAVSELQNQGAKAFVFDVRYNPGGDLNSISEILDFLLPEGPIIRIYDKTGGEEILSSDADALNMPLAVLVNGSTASAAELFAAAIKDYKIGKLVGETTFGKGTMQSIIRLEDNSALAITIAKYNPPFSDNYDGIGVIPNIEVLLPDDLKGVNRYKITDEQDTQLIEAVRILNEELSNPS